MAARQELSILDRALALDSCEIRRVSSRESFFGGTERRRFGKIDIGQKIWPERWCMYIKGVAVFPSACSLV